MSSLSFSIIHVFNDASKHPANEMFVLCVCVCVCTETNQQLLMEWACVRESLVCLLVSSSVAVRRECVTLLILYSHTPHGRSLLTDNLDLHT